MEVLRIHPAPKSPLGFLECNCQSDPTTESLPSDWQSFDKKYSFERPSWIICNHHRPKTKHEGFGTLLQQAICMCVCREMECLTHGRKKDKVKHYKTSKHSSSWRKIVGLEQHNTIAHMGIPQFIFTPLTLDFSCARFKNVLCIVTKTHHCTKIPIINFTKPLIYEISENQIHSSNAAPFIKGTKDHYAYTTTYTALYMPCRRLNL